MVDTMATNIKRQRDFVKWHFLDPPSLSCLAINIILSIILNEHERAGNQ